MLVIFQGNTSGLSKLTHGNFLLQLVSHLLGLFTAFSLTSFISGFRSSWWWSIFGVLKKEFTCDFGLNSHHSQGK